MARLDKITITCAAIIVVLIAAIIYIIWSVNHHFMQVLDGFWVFDEIDSKCILYIDTNTNTMRIIVVSDKPKPVNEKIDASFTSQSWSDLYMRRYQFIGSKSSLGGKYSKVLSKPGLYFDLYPTEGTMILNQADEDIMTFVRDNKLNLELLL